MALGTLYFQRNSNPVRQYVVWLRQATLLCALSICSPVFAADDDITLPSVISASASLDDSDSGSFYLDSDLALPAGLRFSVGGGNNANSATRIDVKTQSYHAGLASNPLDVFAMGFDFEHWGEDNALLSDTWRVDFSLNFDSWALRLSPARSTITGFTRDTTLVSIPPQFEIDSNRYEASFSYFSPSDWNVTAGYTYINYSRDVTKVTTSLRVAALLSPQTLQLISVLDKRRYLFSIGYSIGDDQTGLDLSRTESALDASHYTTLSVFYSKPFATRWAADVTLGQQRANYGDKFNFINLVLNYFW